MRGFPELDDILKVEGSVGTGNSATLDAFTCDGCHKLIIRSRPNTIYHAGVDVSTYLCRPCLIELARFIVNVEAEPERDG